MKLTLSLLFVLALAGCGSSSSVQSCSSSHEPTDPFSARGKLQVASFNQAIDAEVSQFGFVNRPNTGELSKVLEKDTEVVALVKDACLISGQGFEGMEIDDSDRQPTPGGTRSVTWKLPRSMSMDEMNRLVESNDCLVGLADSVDMYTSEIGPTAAGVDPMSSQQNHLKALQAFDAYKTFYNGAQGITRDVVLAVIDSGVDIDHEDLKANVWRNPGEIAGNGIDDDHNGYVDDVNGYNFASKNGNPRPQGGGASHGTHVAGLAAATMGNGVGVMGVMGQHLKIMALNVFGASSGAKTSSIDNAIRYAADNGADIINLSLGGNGRASTTESAIGYAIKKNVTVVAAAGNANTFLSSTSFFTPASYGATTPGMISVGSTDAVKGTRSSFSNYSTTYVEIGAPGSDSSAGGLLATMPGSLYGRKQGTSMASPVTAGSAGLAVGFLRSRGWKITPKIVEDLLESSAQADSKLTSYFKGGRALNLKRLADSMARRFPVSGQSTFCPELTTPN